MNSNNKFGFANQVSTGIFQETPTQNNPFQASECRIHGYEMAQLAQNRSFTDIVFLLFKGELPNAEQSGKLNLLMGLMSCHGPRDNATRAAMVAGIGKTNHEHILPIGLQVLGGEFNGSLEVENSVKFIRNNINTQPPELIKNIAEHTGKGDFHPFPGFGSEFGDISELTTDYAALFCKEGSENHGLAWSQQLVNELAPLGYGWLKTGLVAAVLFDLGFGARESGGLYQIMCAPGILAHGMEQNHKPISAMPLLEDEHYDLKK